MVDRRSRRSQRLIKEAFYRLIVQKPLFRLTVADITREADLGLSLIHISRNLVVGNGPHRKPGPGRFRGQDGVDDDEGQNRS